jgi:hypothetical protein
MQNQLMKEILQFIKIHFSVRTVLIFTCWILGSIALTGMTIFDKQFDSEIAKRFFFITNGYEIIGLLSFLVSIIADLLKTDKKTNEIIENKDRIIKAFQAEISIAQAKQTAHIEASVIDKPNAKVIKPEKK